MMFFKISITVVLCRTLWSCSTLSYAPAYYSQKDDIDTKTKHIEVFKDSFLKKGTFDSIFLNVSLSGTDGMTLLGGPIGFGVFPVLPLLFPIDILENIKGQSGFVIVSFTGQKENSLEKKIPLKAKLVVD